MRGSKIASVCRSTFTFTEDRKEPQNKPAKMWEPRNDSDTAGQEVNTFCVCMYWQ